MRDQKTASGFSPQVDWTELLSLQKAASRGEISAVKAVISEINAEQPCSTESILYFLILERYIG